MQPIVRIAEKVFLVRRKILERTFKTRLRRINNGIAHCRYSFAEDVGLQFAGILQRRQDFRLQGHGRLSAI